MYFKINSSSFHVLNYWEKERKEKERRKEGRKEWKKKRKIKERKGREKENNERNEEGIIKIEISHFHFYFLNVTTV